MSTETRGILLAGVTAFFWGFLAIALKFAVQNFDPYNIVWFRFLLAFSILFLYFRLKDPIKTGILKKPPIALLIASFFLGCNYIGFMQGIHLTSPANTQILIQTGPMLLAVSGVVVYRERLKWYQYIGFLLAGAGMLLFYQEQLQLSVSSAITFNQGSLWVLFGAVSWAVYATIQKSLVQRFHPQQLNLVIYGLPVLMFLPWIDLRAFLDISWQFWLLLCFLGINTIIAYGAISEALKYTEANKVSIIITLNPLITFGCLILLDYWKIDWIENVEISWWSLIFATVVLTGAILVIAGKRKK